MCFVDWTLRSAKSSIAGAGKSFCYCGDYHVVPEVGCLLVPQCMFAVICTGCCNTIRADNDAKQMIQHVAIHQSNHYQRHNWGQGQMLIGLTSLCINTKYPKTQIIFFGQVFNIKLCPEPMLQS